MRDLLLSAAPALGGLLLLVLVVVGWPTLRRWNSGIWAREIPLSVDAPFPLSGRPDLVRWERDFSLSVVDLKTRRHAGVSRADIVQLSAYALLVRKNSLLPVRSTGVVIVQLPDGRRVEKRVPLLSARELSKIYSEWAAIRDGRSDGTPCRKASFCDRCGFRGRECREHA